MKKKKYVLKPESCFLAISVFRSQSFAGRVWVLAERLGALQMTQRIS